jgi:hypothetical protein
MLRQPLNIRGTLNFLNQNLLNAELCKFSLSGLEKWSENTEKM